MTYAQQNTHEAPDYGYYSPDTLSHNVRGRSLQPLAPNRSPQSKRKAYRCDFVVFCCELSYVSRQGRRLNNSVIDRRSSPSNQNNRYAFDSRQTQSFYIPPNRFPTIPPRPPPHGYMPATVRSAFQVHKKCFLFQVQSMYSEEREPFVPPQPQYVYKEQAQSDAYGGNIVVVPVRFVYLFRNLSSFLANTALIANHLNIGIVDTQQRQPLLRQT